MNIAKLNKAEILVALYNSAKPLGRGFLHYTPEDMSIEEAQQLLKESIYFDYIKGRILKVNLGKDELDTFLYNRNNGNGAAENIIVKISKNMR